MTSVQPRGSISVLCTATGYPDPVVTWKVDDGDINSNRLDLTNLIKDTTATCLAENKAGKAQKVLQINVAGAS